MLLDPQVDGDLGIVAAKRSTAQPGVGREGVVDDGVGGHTFSVLSERSSAAVLVRLAAFLCEQRSDAVGEIRTERCLEPATIPLGELSDEALGEIAANCCFEAVEGGYATVLTPMHLLYV